MWTLYGNGHDMGKALLNRDVSSKNRLSIKFYITIFIIMRGMCRKKVISPIETINKGMAIWIPFYFILNHLPTLL